MLFRLYAAQLNRRFGLPFESSRFGILRFDVNGINGAAAVSVEQDKEFQPCDASVFGVCVCVCLIYVFVVLGFVVVISVVVALCCFWWFAPL